MTLRRKPGLRKEGSPDALDNRQCDEASGKIDGHPDAQKYGRRNGVFERGIGNRVRGVRGAGGAGHERQWLGNGDS